MTMIAHPDYSRGRMRPGTYYVGPVGAADPKSSSARTISAKFAGKCPLCKGAIEAGDQVRWEPGRKAVHLECPVSEPAPAPVVEPAPEAEVVEVQVVLARVVAGLTDEQIERAYLADGLDNITLAVLDAEIDARNEEAGMASSPAPVDEPVFGERPGEQEWMAEQVAVGDVEPAREPLTVEHQGVYVLPDGAVVRVKANQTKTRVYASRWTVTGQDRLMGDDHHAHGEYVYEPGLIREVERTGRKMTGEEAKAHSIRYGQCVRCGRSLKDGKSVEAGMGPVCRRYFGL